MKFCIVWKFMEEEEQRKEFSDLSKALRFQAGLMKKKNKLMYTRCDNI